MKRDLAYSVSVQIEWEAGHILMNHPGDCSNPHGHHYKAEIMFERDDESVDEDSWMVVDFSVARKIRDWVMKNWDHTMLLNRADPLVRNWIWKKKPFLFDSDPTAENIARTLQRVANQIVQLETNGRVRAVMVTVWETPKCSATVEVFDEE